MINAVEEAMKLLESKEVGPLREKVLCNSL